MWDCSSPFQQSTSARRQAHVDGHGVVISISKTLGTAAVPANQCVGLDDREGVPPVEGTREMGKRKTNGVGSAPRLDLSLNVEAELFAEEQILGGNSSR